MMINSNSFEMYDTKGGVIVDLTPEELYILILDNAVREAKNRELRMGRQIASLITEHRKMILEVHSLEDQLTTSRDHFIRKAS